MNPKQRRFYRRYINIYTRLKPIYEKYTEVLELILKNIAREHLLNEKYIIEGRTKSTLDFANKISLPGKKYTDPISQIPDKSAVRIIVPNLDLLDKTCNEIRKSFIIDEENGDKTESVFGYNFISFKVLLRLPVYYEIKFNLKIPDYIKDLKAEIQVLTFLQYGWEVNHEKFHKSEFEPPAQYTRELNKVAALLIFADNTMNDVMKKMHEYETSYGAYMSRENIIEEIIRLEMVYESLTNQTDLNLALKIAKMAMLIQDWEKSIAILNKVLQTREWHNASNIRAGAILRDLGTSMCKRYAESSEQFQTGLSHLITAIRRNPNDSEAYSNLGGAYKKQNDDEKAHECYKKALEIDPGNPYPLGNYLIYELRDKRNLLPIKLSEEMIKKAIKKRKLQVEVNIDYPWVFYDLGLFYLFLGKREKSLNNYLLAIRFSQETWMIDTTLKTLERLENIYDQIKYIHLIRCLLLLGKAFHPESQISKDILLFQSLKEELDHPDFKLRHQRDEFETELKDLLIIIAGGTDERLKTKLLFYRNNLVQAFKNIKANIISGGTKAGISQIVGDIQKKYPESIKTFGYIPYRLPSDIERDKRYYRIHVTSNDDFSIVEVFRYWYDILQSKTDPGKVKLIGINGGRISALEFRMAITFGAQVGIIEESGRAATELIHDSIWTTTHEKEWAYRPKKLFKILKNTPKDIESFLKRPFVYDVDIENIRKLLIQSSSGMPIFEKDFSEIPISGALMSGLLSAINSFTQEIGFGELPTLSAKQGSITMNSFNDDSFRVFLFLFKEASSSLETKLNEFTILCEKELSNDFIALNDMRTFEDEKRIAEILSRVFGSEILKFFEDV